MDNALLFLLTGIALICLGAAPFAKEMARALHVAAAVLGVIILVGAVLRF